MPTLYLVRHGRPLAVPGRPAATWELDPAGFDDVWVLRESGRLPDRAVWLCSPEPKAVATAQLLTETDVGIVDDLREHERSGAWLDDFEATVARAVTAPDTSAYDGWEPLAACRDRVVGAAETIRRLHPDDDVVLVGHGTAWAVLLAHLEGRPVDLHRWRSWGFPDVVAWRHGA